MCLTLKLFIEVEEAALVDLMSRKAAEGSVRLRQTTSHLTSKVLEEGFNIELSNFCLAFRTCFSSLLILEEIRGGGEVDDGVVLGAKERPGGDGCIGRVEGLGGVQALLPALGLRPETMLERGEGAGDGEGVEGGEGGQRGVDWVGDHTQEECG